MTSRSVLEAGSTYWNIIGYRGIAWDRMENQSAGKVAAYDGTSWNVEPLRGITWNTIISNRLFDSFIGNAPIGLQFIFSLTSLACHSYNFLSYLGLHMRPTPYWKCANRLTIYTFSHLSRAYPPPRCLPALLV